MTAQSMTTSSMTLRRFALALIVFALLGPPLGALVFLSPMLIGSIGSAIARGDASADELMALPQFIGMICLFSYLFGGPPAVASGGVLAAMAAYRGRAPGYVEAALVGAALSFAIILAFFAGGLGGGIPPPPTGISLSFGFVGGLAALACTALCRWWGLFAFEGQSRPA